ncbi:MAG: PAS domain S-box protein [candidate division Zixibacteria bacterium]|nr:PAS domain S-box protein [candidate division Zixibacteria bacterium]
MKKSSGKSGGSPSEEYLNELQNLRSIFDNCCLGIYRTTPDGQIIMANSALIQMLGYDNLDDLLSRDLEKSGFSENSPRFEFVDKLEGKCKIIGYKSLWICKNGSTIEVRESARAVKDKQGNTLYFEGTVEKLRDTESENATLQYHSRHYQALLDSISETAFLIKTDGTVMAANEAVCRRLKLTKKELVGKNIFDLLPEDVGDYRRKMVDRAVTSRKPVNFNDVRAGSHLFSTVYPILNDQGDVESVSVFARDITELKITERAVKESENRLRAAFSALPDYYFVFDENGYYMDYLAKHDEYVAKTPDGSVIGNRLHDTVGDGLAEKSVAKMREAIETGQPQYLEYYLDFPDGRHWYEGCAAKIDTKPEERKRVVWVAREITDKKRIEEEIKQSELHYRGLIENIPRSAVFVIDKDLRIITAEGREIKTAGFERDKIEGKLLSDILSKATCDKLVPLYKKALAGESVTTELPLGETYYLVQASPLISENGKINKIIVFSQNITDIREMHEALKTSESFLATLIESAEDIIILHDLNGQYLYYHGPKAFGMTNESVKGKYVHDLFPTEIANPIVEQIKRVGQTGKSEQFENRVIWKNQTLWFLDNIFPVRNEQGEIVSVAKICHNITERKNMEKALEESERHFRTVADFTYGWEFWIDPEGAFLYVSPSCERITGYTFVEFMQNSDLIFDIVHEDDREILRNHLKQEVETDSALEVQFRIIDKSGETRWISHVCQSVYDSDGQYLGRRASNRDSTRRILAEKEREVLIENLKEALAKVKTLSGFIPICPSCKKIRDDEGYWNQIEKFLKEHSEAEFTHALCPECARKLYPDLYNDENDL